MAWVDIGIIALVVISTVIGVLRGLVREVLSLAAWIVAFWLALAFAGTLAPHLGFVSESDAMRTVAAFVALFVGTLVVVAFVNHIVVALVKGAGLSGVDRAAGMAFGVARGVAVVAALMVIGLTAGAQSEAWWQSSRAIAFLEPVAEWMQGFLPRDIGNSA